MSTYFCVYLGSAFLAILLTPLVIRLANRIGAVDQPGVRTVHQQPVPRIGGVAIFASAMGLIPAVLFLDNVIGVAFREMQKQLTAVFCCSMLVFLIGLVDDLKGLPARFKFLAELVAAAALCVVGVRIDSFGITESFVVHLGSWGFLLTVLWVVGITNAVNLSDGLDGLAAGVSAITCGVIAVFAIHSGDVVLAVFMLALVGSLSGFLVFNFNPARVFMGDCGSLFLGFTIAASSVLCVAKSTALVALSLPALALGIPIFDTFFSMLRRYLERRSLFAPDRSHFHHRLLDLGFHQRHAVILIYLATVFAAGLGLFMLIRDDLGSLVVFACVLFLIVLLFRIVGAVHPGATLAALQHKRYYARQERETQRTFERLQLGFRHMHNDRWWQALCDAAQQLGLAWISVHIENANGTVDTFVWRAQSVPRESARVVTVSLPIFVDRRWMEFEAAVLVNGSLESASHRLSLFGRLIDEGAVRNSAIIAERTPRPGPVVCHH